MNLKRHRNRILQGTIIAFGIFILLFILADLRAAADQLRTFPLWLLLPISFLKLVNYSFRYMEWHYLLGVVGIRVAAGMPSGSGTLRLRDSIATYLVGFPMQISPGKAAEVLKCAIVKNLTGVPIARTAPVVLTERVIDGLAVLVLIGAASATAPEAIFTDAPNRYMQSLILATMVVMLFAIAAIQFKPAAYWMLNVLAKIPLLGRVAPWLREFYESSYLVLRLPVLVPTVGFGLVAYGTDCLALYLMLWGLGLKGGGIVLAQATFILGFAVIVAALSALPAGAGARELSTSVLIHSIIGTGIGVAESATILNTFFQVVLGVLIGLGVGLAFRKVLFPTNLEAVLADSVESRTLEHNLT